MHYIWDNYVELSESDNVVFIGHGTGCSAIMDLINTRGELRILPQLEGTPIRRH